MHELGSSGSEAINTHANSLFLPNFDFFFNFFKKINISGREVTVGNNIITWVFFFFFLQIDRIGFESNCNSICNKYHMFS